MSEAVRLEAEADRAASSGEWTTARRLLEKVTAADPRRLDPWLKLSAMCRSAGDLDGALAAVTGALRAEPLAFLPLLLKASLFEQAGRAAEAAETYGYALAQRPDPAPPHLAPMIARAEAAHAAYVAARAAALEAAAAAVALDPRERPRVERFRSNIVRTTRVYHSEPTHFHYPGLAEREFHDSEDFPWLAELEAAAPRLREEFAAVMAAERTELVPYIQYPDDVPLRQWERLNRNHDWTAIHLVANGAVVEANAGHCPEAMALLRRIDQPDVPGRGPNAMFSLLAPGAHIPPHTGVANTRLVCHLPLIVPEGCWFRVGAEKRLWEVGKAWVFDDTIEHEAMNPSGALRVILIVDCWHPGLSAAEREAVTAVMAASDGSDAAARL